MGEGSLWRVVEGGARRGKSVARVEWLCCVVERVWSVRCGVRVRCAMTAGEFAEGMEWWAVANCGVLCCGVKCDILFKSI